MVLKLDDRTLLNNESAGDKKRCKTEDVGSLLLVENAAMHCSNASMHLCLHWETQNRKESTANGKTDRKQQEAALSGTHKPLLH